MYRYDHMSEMDESLWMVFNSYLGDDVIYRVSYPSSDRLILIFTSEDEMNKFRSKHLSKFTCDISSMTYIGLTLIISDRMKIQSIITKVANDYKAKNLNSSASIPK